MGEPFVFQFRPGPRRAPMALYMLDLDCACGTCGYEQFQRFYHAMPFHEATVEGLEERLLQGPLKAGYACENCGDPVGASQVRRVSVSYGFSDDAGTIQLFLDMGTGARAAELTPFRRLDPQAVPRWDVQEDESLGRVVAATIDDVLIEEVMGRPFNVKLAWRDLLDDFVADAEGGAFSKLARGLWAVIDESEEAAVSLMEEIEDEDFWEALDDGDLAVISLHDSVPEDLATHEAPARMPGRWQTWLPDSVVREIQGGAIWADAYLSRSAAEEVLRRTFDVANLKYHATRTEADLFFLELTTPTGAVYGRSLSLSSVLRRAAYTGLTPGEAARLTAEEIIGVLLQVWE